VLGGIEHLGGRSPFELCWGKRTDNGDFYALDGHLIDTAIVAELLWDRTFEEHTKRWFVSHLGADARRLIALLAGSHDCGKLAPTFQCRLLDRVRPRWAPDADPMVRASAVPIGDVRVVHGQNRVFLSHAMESGRTLERAGADAWWSRVVEGHHGRFADPDATPGAVLHAFQSDLETSSWPTAQHEALEMIADLLGVNLAELSGRPWPETAATAVITAAGWVSIADWLASDERSVEHGVVHQHLLGDQRLRFVSERRRFLASQVDDLIGLHHTPPGSFDEVFGFAPSRPVQQFVTDGHSPELAIITVPMGAGKTEAALERHRRLGSSSLYFALPTMATADVMFARVQKFFVTASATTGALLHGRASVNDFYAGAQESSFVHQGDTDTGLVASHWLRGRHRGLLAPVGVGTVDQVLAAVLRAKYSTVRLAAVANTHIVFDEAHSYDPYQQALFCVVLRWLGLHHTPVTVLSATLPSEAATAFVAAYRAGWFGVGTLPRGGPLKVSYPGAITVEGGDEAAVVPIGAHDHREVAMRFERCDGNAVDAMSACVRQLRADHPQAAIGVIVNRVSRCIDIATELEDLSPVVLHARMPTRLRATRQRDVVAAVAQGSPARGQLVVGTQVLEQSLDIDFDFLVSDLAPAPDLIQRTGRLWRHSTCTNGEWAHPRWRSWRQNLVGPTTYVFAPSEFTERETLPYMPGVLDSTWTNGFASGERTILTVPDDLQEIVDASHVTFTAETLEQPATADLLAAVRVKRAAAYDRCLPLDDILDEYGSDFLVDVTSGVGNNDETSTRWQDEPSETFTVVSGRNPWALDREALAVTGLARDRAIVDASLSLSGTTLHRVSHYLRDLDDLVPDRPRRPLGRYLDLDNVEDVDLHPIYGLRVPTPPHRSDVRSEDNDLRP